MLSSNYVIVVIALLALHYFFISYERQSRILVERERGKALTSLKLAQQAEREDDAATKQAIIADAAWTLRTLRARKDAEQQQGSGEVPAATPDQSEPVQAKATVWHNVAAAATLAPAGSDRTDYEDDEVFTSEPEDDTVH